MELSAYEEMAHIEADHWWFCGRRSISRRLLDCHFQETSRKILEVGCGTGGNLEMLQSRGQVTAVEIEESACDYVINRKLNDLQLIRASFPECTAQIESDEGYGAICFFDVLEHLDDDFAALSAAKQLLSPNGRILLTVPAYTWLWSTHDERLHHRRRYNRNTLSSLIQRTGLRVVYLGHFNTFLLPLLMAARTADRLFKRKTSSGSNLPGLGLNLLFKQLLVLESKLIPTVSLPFGSSLVAVLEK